MEKIKVTQTRSKIGTKKNMRATLDALGLRRIGHTVEHNATPQINGMLKVVHHLVTVEKV